VSSTEAKLEAALWAIQKAIGAWHHDVDGNPAASLDRITTWALVAAEHSSVLAARLREPEAATPQTAEQTIALLEASIERVRQ
jgi:hypothetical protein